MSKFPTDAQYTKEHEWIRIAGDSAEIGITSFAIEQLGDVVHLDLPKAGAEFKAGESFGTIESTKTVSDLYMPAAGKVVEVNSALLQAPEDIANDPHGKFWLLKVTLNSAPAGLMSAEQYSKYIAEEANH
ncbi:MAG: glycine cleavage system protein GcvH [Pseudomonadota bacterium]|jgi:glycine cleavage system H protein